MTSNASPTSRTLVVLHGHASSATAANRVGRQISGGAHVVAVEAPFSVEGNPLARSWFVPESGNGLAESVASVRTVVDELCSAGTRVVVVGLSQGAAVALAAFGPAAQSSLAGLVVWSGFAVELPAAEELSLAGLAGIDLLVVHGRDDDVVPIWMADDVAALAREVGARVTVAHVEGGHDRTPESIDLVARWLTEHAH